MFYPRPLGEGEGEGPFPGCVRPRGPSPQPSGATVSAQGFGRPVPHPPDTALPGGRGSKWLLLIRQPGPFAVYHIIGPLAVSAPVAGTPWISELAPGFWPD